MPAPNLKTLFAGDMAIEKAFALILTAAGVNADSEFSSVTKKTPYVDLLSTFKATDARFDYLVPGSSPAIIYRFPHRWEGTLDATVCTTRGVNSDQQQALVGLVRECGLEWRTRFTTDQLPWWGINLFLDVGRTPTIDQDNRLDKNTIHFRVHFNIRGDGANSAWPA
jgi:hypothetical protein